MDNLPSVQTETLWEVIERENVKIDTVNIDTVLEENKQTDDILEQIEEPILYCNEEISETFDEDMKGDVTPSWDGALTQDGSENDAHTDLRCARMNEVLPIDMAPDVSLRCHMEDSSTQNTPNTDVKADEKPDLVVRKRNSRSSDELPLPPKPSRICFGCNTETRVCASKDGEKRKRGRPRLGPPKEPKQKKETKPMITLSNISKAPVPKYILPTATPVTKATGSLWLPVATMPASQNLEMVERQYEEYRKIQLNAKECERRDRITQEFARLKSLLPKLAKKKLAVSKIQILKGAISRIRELREILDQPPRENHDFSHESKIDLLNPEVLTEVTEDADIHIDHCESTEPFMVQAVPVGIIHIGNPPVPKQLYRVDCLPNPK